MKSPQSELVFTDEGEGAPVVFLHAFPLDGRMWAEQTRELARAARVIVPDLGGFGQSHSLDRRTLDQHADDVAILLDALDIERATLVGLSMGGYIALAFARRYAGRLAALGLADTRATPDSDEGKRGRDENIALVEREGVASLVERMLPKLLSTRAPHDLVERVRGVGSSQTARAIQSALAAMRDRPDSTSVLARLDVPTTVIVGEADSLTPPSDARAMAEALGHAELEVIPGAGHLANLEAPAPFTQAVQRLMAQTTARR